MKQRISGFWRAVRARPFLAVFVVGAVLFLVWKVFFSNGEEPLQTITVTRGEFFQQVSVSGKVVAGQEVDLAFSETGRVEALNVDVGDKVSAGQTLATLGINVLASDLRVAEQDLEKVRREQDALVASAYRTLLSDDLAAVPSSSYGITAPVITGIYDGAEGSYRVRITKQENSTHYDMRTFDLEAITATEILDDEPTALGTRGLFISLPDGQEAYDDTIWYISVPNTKSASYLANYNAYQEALRARDRAITAAEADIDRARTEIAERILRAPFSGIVTAVDTEVGGTVASNEAVISLIGDDTLQIESFTPEVNIAQLSLGDTAKITLDAYGKTTFFNATVISIDPAETVRDGVSTYKTVLQFTEDDPRIRSGMTANIAIETERKADTLVVPQGAIIKRGTEAFVQIVNSEKEVEERPVVVGLTSLGQSEIIAGLEEGDVVVLNPTP